MSENVTGYYEEFYSSESISAFPEDPSRYQAWLGSILTVLGPSRSLLDYGCGVGFLCSLAADRGCTVTGMDISGVAISIAAERERRASFVRIEERGTLPCDANAFDVVTCLGVLEHIPEPAPVVAELRRVARRGARSIWVVPNARSPYFWLGHGTGQVEEHPRTLGEWRELLTEGGWEIEAVRRDPGPIDRPVAAWKRLAQSILNRLPLGLTYQFVIEARAVD